MFTKTDIEKYFIAEKSESLLFLAIGIIAIILAIVFFFFIKGAFYKGAAVPLLLIGLLQVAVGYTVYSRSDEQRISIAYAYDMNPGKLQSDELPRMKTVNKNFITYRWIEIALLIAGLSLFFIFKYDVGKQFWFGLGVTLVVQATLMLGADYFAEKRAINYTTKLDAFINRR